MNKTTIKWAALVVTGAGVTTGWLLAQAQDDTYNPSQPGQPRSSQTTTTTPSAMEVKKINKASELIGMDVKNQQGEKIGDIKDVVFDFKNERVGYVVLSADPGALQAEKLHAVPLKAFQPSADGDSLILNVDKQKLASAQGFSKDSWPNPSNPSWGAQPFWQGSQQNPSTPGYRPGTPPGTTPDRGTTPR
jgi:sporulation protein YlmC with PRC-barrel domain